MKQLIILKNLKVGLIIYPVLQSHQEKNDHMQKDALCLPKNLCNICISYIYLQ